MKPLDKSLVEKALLRMGELALESGLKLEISIYGGALMMLAYNARSITKDVDAVLSPSKEGLAIARRVGRELGLPEHWLNDDVKLYLAPSGQMRTLPREVPGLVITAPTAGYLLAMKALACRNPLPGHEGDWEDLRFLLQKMNIRSVDEIQAWIDRFYPDDVLQPEHQRTLEILIEEGATNE